MVYVGTWNEEDSQYEFNVTALKVFQDMQAGKLTVLNIEYENTPFSILLEGGYASTEDDVTHFQFYVESTLATILSIDSIVDATEGNLVIIIAK